MPCSSPRSRPLPALLLPRPLPPPSGAAATPLGSALAAAAASDYANAEKALQAIVGADRPAALVALARISLEQGRFADANRYATQAGTTGQRLAALAIKAEVLSAQGKVDDAIALLEPNKAGQGVGGRRVRLVLGELYLRAGRRADAEPVLLEFASEYGNDTINSSDAEGLAMVGRAMHLLRHAKDANRAYDESERAQKGRVETLMWRATLFLDKYDPGHAEEVLTEALKAAPHRADAMIMLARVKLEEAYDFAAADKLVASALAVNPSLIAAYAVRAGIALRDMNLEAANAAVGAGLAIDPNDLELLSIRAAVRFLGDDKAGYEAAKREVLARNKEYSRFYGTVGDFAEWEHRYDDVIGMMKEAVALDPKDSKAWAQLGLMQARGGDEADGVKSLEQAWKGDHYNVRVFNTLDKLYGQWIPNEYEEVHEGIFHLRYPKDEKAVLERYVPRMLGEAWGAMKVHYMFAPTAPVAVELYRARDHFSVRTSGLPNIGIQGVCFGHVVAAMSPASEPFNWGNVVWHELGHVFAIQLSKNHVPRWFTEGLSEYETMVRRPEWQRELDPELYVALKKGRLAERGRHEPRLHPRGRGPRRHGRLLRPPARCWPSPPSSSSWAKITQALTLPGARASARRRSSSRRSASHRRTTTRASRPGRSPGSLATTGSISSTPSLFPSRTRRRLPPRLRKARLRTRRSPSRCSARTSSTKRSTRLTKRSASTQTTRTPTTSPRSSPARART